MFEILFQLKERYFCLRAPLEVSFRFDLPEPRVSLDTLPLLLSLNGQPEIAVALLSIMESLGHHDESNSTQINRFIINLGTSEN